MPKANSSLGRQDNKSPKEPKRQGHWHRQRSLPPSRHHYLGSYHALPGGASDLRRSDIPERQDYGRQRTLSDEHYTDYSHSAYPPPLMDFSTVAESDIDFETKKSMFRNVMRSVATFMVQAQNNESDLNLLREALLDIVSEKEGSSSRNLDHEMLNSLVKRVEICETRLPDASTLERLSALEQRVNVDSSTLLARIERLEEKVFETRNVENDCEIVEAHKNESPKLDQRNKKARWYQPSSSLFPTPSQDLKKIESNSFLSSKSQKTVSMPKEKEGEDFENMANRLASVIESKLTSDNVLLKRLESLESHMKEKMSVLTEKLFSPQRDRVEPTRQPRSDVIRSMSSSSDSDIIQPEDIEIKEEKEDTASEPRLRFIMDSDDYVVIHTDGIGNLKANQRGSPGVRVWFGDNHALNVSRPVEEQTSNKSAQLLATYAALSQSNQAGLTKVRVYTSSAYIIRCFQKLNSWNERDWMSSRDTKLRLKHADHFKEIFQFLRHIQADFRSLMDENCARSMDITVMIKNEPS